MLGIHEVQQLMAKISNQKLCGGISKGLYPVENKVVLKVPFQDTLIFSQFSQLGS